MNPAGAHTVVFSCQWSPHYCLQTLYFRERRGGDGAVRILASCAGRMAEDLVLESFRRGAAAVWVLHCPPELCRHGLNEKEFQTTMERAGKILEMLGIPKERFVVRAYRPHQGEELVKELSTFSASLQTTRGEQDGV